VICFMRFQLADLGVPKTHSRPHVCDDNPYSESQFRILNYRPEFPDRFGCIQDIRACREALHINLWADICSLFDHHSESSHQLLRRICL
jgi:hypothetical protein